MTKGQLKNDCTSQLDSQSCSPFLQHSTVFRIQEGTATNGSVTIDALQPQCPPSEDYLGLGPARLGHLHEPPVLLSGWPHFPPPCSASGLQLLLLLGSAKQNAFCTQLLWHCTARWFTRRSAVLGRNWKTSNALQCCFQARWGVTTDSRPLNCQSRHL
jgi:hypothetical protein